jgi:D-alanyl-D-alanine carboxypeptidase
VSLIERSLLTADSYKAQFQPVVLTGGRVQDYGLGLNVETVQGRFRIGHSGAGSGFRADNRVWPAERAAIIVLTNNDWADPGDLTERIAFITLAPTAAEARVRGLFQAFQNGTVDRETFSATGKFYLTAAVLADLKSSLGPRSRAHYRARTRKPTRRPDHAALENPLPRRPTAGDRTQPPGRQDR